VLVKLINRYVRPYWGLLLGVLCAQLIAVSATLWLPSLNAQIIDNGVTKGDIGYIWRRGALMLGVSAVQMVAQITSAYFGARTALSFSRDLRGDLFKKVLSFSTREVNQFGAPSLITRNSNDVQQVQMLVLMTCLMMVSAPLTMVGGVFMALREDIPLSWIILVAVIAMGGFIGVILSLMSPAFRKQQKLTDTINQILREQITGVRVIRAFTREDDEQDRFDKPNEELMRLQFYVGTLFSILFPIIQLVLGCSNVAVIWFGGHRIDSGAMQIGQLTAFLTYLMQILVSVMMATMMMMLVPRAAACAQRIMEVLNTSSSVGFPVNPITELPGRGVVRFEDVEFAYPGADEPVLCNLNFELRPGQTTAIVGSTGAGKTTLINLIPRLYDPTGGRVLVDGVDVREIDPDVLWSKVSLVPQKAYLFSGTIASNLRYGDPSATDEQLWQALRVAQSDDFIAEKDGQLEAEVAQGGTNFSGGQRQRLSIARALVKQPEIYVFDDAFSALDVTTDAKLRAALSKTTQDATVLIVAQRISTIRHADQIIVLDNGQIEAIGTHAELLANSATYREIVESQQSIEEAA